MASQIRQKSSFHSIPRPSRLFLSKENKAGNDEVKNEVVDFSCEADDEEDRPFLGQRLEGEEGKSDEGERAVGPGCKGEEGEEQAEVGEGAPLFAGGGGGGRGRRTRWRVCRTPSSRNNIRSRGQPFWSLLLCFVYYKLLCFVLAVQLEALHSSRNVQAHELSLSFSLSLSTNNLGLRVRYVRVCC